MLSSATEPEDGKRKQEKEEEEEKEKGKSLKSGKRGEMVR
jgi:hypothetical protein